MDEPIYEAKPSINTKRFWFEFLQIVATTNENEE